MTMYVYSIYDNVEELWSPLHAHVNDDVMALSLLDCLNRCDSFNSFDVDRYSIYRVGMYDDQICILEPIDHVDITQIFIDRRKELLDMLSKKKGDTDES